MEFIDWKCSKRPEQNRANERTLVIRTHTHTHTPPNDGKYEKGLKMLCGLSQEKSLKMKICSIYQRSVSI